MVEQTEKGWLTVIEDQCSSRGFIKRHISLRIMGLTVRPTCPCSTKMTCTTWHPKPIQLKKFERWCDSVRPRAENTLPSSSNAPGGAVLLSSEALNVKPETIKHRLLDFPDQFLQVKGGHLYYPTRM
jgi:hypothetical protein